MRLGITKEGEGSKAVRQYKTVETRDGDLMEFDGLAPLGTDEELWFSRLGGRGYRSHKAIGFKVYVYAAQGGGYDSIVTVQAKCGVLRCMDCESEGNAGFLLTTEPSVLHTKCEKCTAR